MTLKEMKIKTFSLIEEYYPELGNLAEDEDVINKFNNVVNQVQMDLMQFRKQIEHIMTERTSLEDPYRLGVANNNYYQLYKVVLYPMDESMSTEFKILEPTLVEVSKDFLGTVDFLFYQYPEHVQVEFDDDEARQKYDEEFTFTLDKKLLEIMPYGIARDLLRLDMISSYGAYFEKTYNELIQRLDSRFTSGLVMLEGGIDV